MAERNILIIGNGFDLYHKLPTRYIDFLMLIANWNVFYNNYKDNLKKGSGNYDVKEFNIRLSENGELNLESLEDFAKYARIYDTESIEFLNSNIKNNILIKHFYENRKKIIINNWVNFEAEIENYLKTIEIFYNFIRKEYRTKSYDDNKYILNTYEHVGQFIETLSQNLDIELNNPFYSDYLPETEFEEKKEKKKLLLSIKNQLDDFIKCFKIYISEFVSRLKITVKSKTVCDLLSNYMELYSITFNYTDTIEKIYNLDKMHCHYVHGSTSKDNIVLGIDDNAFDNNDYIYFQKYYQRIQKMTGSIYLKWLAPPLNDYFSINLHIFGHSLDKTDKGILKDLFFNDYVKQVIIYYHNQRAYEDLVINLVEMFGKDYVIENTGSGKIVFKELEKPIPIIENKTEKKLLTT